MPKSTEAFLADVPMFRGLNPIVIELLSRAPQRRYRKNEVLWTAGSAANGFVIVVRGRIRVVRAPSGRQFSIHTEGPGGTLGDVPFFAGGNYPATAIAMEPSTCLILDRTMIVRGIAIDAEFAFQLLARLAGRVRGLVERLDEQTTRTVEQRLARLLLQRDDNSERKSFLLGATQAEAAEEIGTVREVLVRTLRRFRKAGLVEAPARGWYRVRKRARLEHIVNSSGRQDG